MKACPACGEPNPERFRICGICGASLTGSPAPLEARRSVSIVFCDLKDSTGQAERLDSETWREVLATYFDAMRVVISQHGGTVEKYIGDAIMAVFGLPTAHEDDALRAVRAAEGMRTRLADLNPELERRWGVRLEARTGVNTGAVVAGESDDAQRLVTGATVNTAARIEQAAAPGEVLIGESTYALVRGAIDAEPAGALALKGIADPVVVYRLEGISGFDSLARRPDAQLVGRVSEFAVLRDAFERARRDANGQRATIVGPAGIGKSRLVDEFLGSVPGAVVLRGRCLSYGEGITFWPLAEAIRGAAGIEEPISTVAARARLGDLCAGRSRIAERLAPLLGLSDAVFPLEETFWAARRLVETLAESAPVVLVLEDIHWAQATFLDLIADVASAMGQVLVVCTERDDPRDDGTTRVPGDGEVLVRLEALGESEIERVLQGLLASSDVPGPLVGRLVRATGGNPLFVEQLVSSLIDGGLLARAEDGSWAVVDEVARLPMPPSIGALLSSRIDRLSITARSVLQAGATIGLEFYRGAVEAMLPPSLAEDVDGSLATLEQRRFIRSIGRTFAEEQTFAFSHMLVRDAAYDALLLRRRIDLHERAAAWLEGAAGARLVEFEEIIGFHLEQGARYLADLGPLDERGLAMATAASDRLARSGARADSRGDLPAAAQLLGRAAALRSPDDRSRVELQLDLAEVRVGLGELEAADAALQEAVAGAATLADALLATNARLVGLFIHFTVDPHGRSDEVLREATAAIPSLEAVGDHEGLVRAWRLLGWVHGTACRYGEAGRAVRQAVHHARLAGDRRAETRNQMSFAIAALHGPTPVPKAIALCDRVATEVAGDRRAEAVVLGASAQLHAMAGRFDEARDLYGRARSLIEELGSPSTDISLDSGPVELLAGAPNLAERELRRDYDFLTEIGERYLLSTVAALLADAVLAQGRADEAMTLTEISESAAAEDDIEAQNLWRRSRARILLGQGRLEPAARLAGEALDLIRSTDAPVLRAGSLLDIAAIHAAAGRRAEAIAVGREALELYEAKRDAVEAARAAELVASLA